MRDVVGDLRLLESRAETAVRDGDADPDTCVGLGVQARNLGVVLGTTPLPPLAEGSIRERAMMLTHHGEALARAALAGQELERIRALMEDLEADTHLLRGALEAARFDGKH